MNECVGKRAAGLRLTIQRRGNPPATRRSAAAVR